MPVGDPLELLLAGRYPDPDTGELLAATARTVVIEPSLDGAECDLVERAGIARGAHLALVADTHTYAALGQRVERALASRFTVQRIVLEAGVETDEPTVARVAAALEAGTDALVAVGSGTINDICKLVATARACPDVVFATAPSMNGYTSLSASVSERGFKRSVRAITPVGVFFDLGVLAAAPLRLIRSGLGDSLARPTAQADWLLSHLILDRPYREAPFAMLAADEAALFAQAQALIARDEAAIRHLVRVLVLSGFGMTLAGGSYPASQGEHLISHYFELVGHGLPHTFHGEQIAVASVALARLQDRVLERGEPPQLRPTQLDRATVMTRIGAEQGDACWRETEQKLLDRAQVDAINARLEREWSAIRARILRATLGAPKMIDVLTAAGAPVEPEAIGWPRDLLSRALHDARLLRNRYGFMDFAAELQ